MLDPMTTPTSVEGGSPSGHFHSQSAASWPAIIAGAFVATALSLFLLALGSGLGFASVSPWPNAGMSGMSLVVTAAIWLIVTQWLSAAVGGYLAGRLRRRWIGTHTHEVFFRDTAHGLITWAVATVLVAGTLASTTFSTLGTMSRGAGAVVGQAAKGATALGASPGTSYGIDKLFRPGKASSVPVANSPRGDDPKAEVANIIANSLGGGSVSDVDRTYLAQLIASRTGVSPEEAKARVDDLMSSVGDAEAKAKALSDKARKDAALGSIYLALSMLVGAFIACASAALGGRLRDAHP